MKKESAIKTIQKKVKAMVAEKKSAVKKKIALKKIKRINKKFIADPIFERITDAFVALDKNWCYTYMNKKAGEIFQRDPQVMIGKNIWIEFPEGINQPFYHAYYKAMTEQKYIYLEEHYAPYDLWFENHIYPSPEGLSIYFRDITSKKKDEENLRMTSQRLTKHLNNTPLAVIEWDKNMIIRKWSAQAETIFGWNEAEVVNKHFNELNLVYEDDAQAVGIIAQQLMTGAVDQNKIINRNNTKNGKIIYCQWFNSVLKDEKGNVASILSLMQEITESKEAADVLKEKELMLSESQRIAHIGSWTLNMTGQINWSDETYRIFGVSHENFILTPESFLNLLHPDDRTAIQERIQKTLSGEKPGEIEYRIILPDGTIRFLVGNGELIIDKNNNPLYVRGTLQDITERKKAQELLKLSENRFRTAFENAATGMCLVSPEGKFIQVNLALCTMVGYTMNELMVKSISDVTHPDDISLTFQNVDSTINSENDTLNFEKRYLRKNGEIIWINITSSLIRNEDKKPLYFITQVIDITQRKKAHLILASEKMVLEMIATEKPLIDILNAIVLNYESYSEHSICSILLLNEEGTHVRHGAAPGLPDAYNNLIEGEPIGPVAGSCGTAVYRKERVIVADIATDPLWVNYRDFALSFGLKACWSTPIINTQGKVYGTFAIYYKECRIPGEDDLILIDRSANQVKIVLERYYKETQLKESELKYRSLIDQASDAIMVTDFNGIFLDVNDCMTRMSGYSKDELIGKKTSDFMDAEQLKERPFQLEEELAGRQVFNERKFIRKNGTTIEVEANVKKINDNMVLAIVRDITGRKKAERELAESENRLQTIIRSEPECIKLLNQKGELLSMNPAGLAMIEADSEDQVLGKQIKEIVKAKYKKGFIKLTNDVFNGETGKLEFEITGLKGTNRWLETHAVPMRDTDGNIISLLGVTRDITEQKMAEEKLMANEIKYRNVVENIHESLIIEDVDGHVVFANNEFTKLFGFNSDEIKKLSIIDYTATESANEVLERHTKRMNGEVVPDEFIYKAKRKDGSEFWSEARVTLIKQDGKITGSQTIEHDITERIIAEQKILEQTNQLRNLSARLQSIREEERTNMAHDIHDVLGQQLTIVKMNLHSMLKKHKNISPDFDAQAEVINDSLNKTVNTVRKIASELRPVILDEQGLDDALKIHCNEFSKQTGISCNINIESNVLIDDININTQVYRIYQEALTNVARHSKATEVNSSMKIENGFLKLLITDNGKGFDAEKNTEKKSLGLVMMRERATSIGAALQIISEPNQGTSILLTLPLNNS